MTSLRVRGLSFGHTDRVSLFSKVDFDLAPGFTGLVGANGAGKTTLLRLLAGELVPDEARVRADPPFAKIALCPQLVESADEAILRFGRTDDGSARRLRGELRLDPSMPTRWETLSPGERKRWQIGSALFEEPDVLLLDEPTNHLDAEARELLIGALIRFSGIGIVVSHDRDLLEALTTQTLRIHLGQARLWPGSYEQARAEWEREEEAAISQRERPRNEERKQKRKLDRARREQEKASANKSARRRMKDENDSDARSIGAANKADWEDRVVYVPQELTVDEAVKTLRAIQGLSKDERGRVPSPTPPVPPPTKRRRGDPRRPHERSPHRSARNLLQRRPLTRRFPPMRWYRLPSSSGSSPP